MLNKVMLIGRLGGDPQLTFTKGGNAVASFNIATGEVYFDKEGNKQERTEWHRISVWQKAAENAAKHLSKGDLIYAEGALQTQEYTNKEGEKRKTTQVRAYKLIYLQRKGAIQRQETTPYEDQEEPFENYSPPTDDVPF